VAAKQTGPAQPVKRRDHEGYRFGLKNLVVGALIAAILAACASVSWHQAGKSAQQTSQDLAACERDAESTTLASSGANRGDFPLPNAQSNQRGPSPLEFHDRTALSQRYDDAVGRCMRAEGYMQGHPADQR
jgi:hypothetical protein